MSFNGLGNFNESASLNNISVVLAVMESKCWYPVGVNNIMNVNANSPELIQVPITMILLFRDVSKIILPVYVVILLMVVMLWILKIKQFTIFSSQMVQ